MSWAVRVEGATAVEAYPVEPYSEKMPAAFAWTGIASAFEKAGFVEVLRRSAARPILRRTTISRFPAETFRSRDS